MPGSHPCVTVQLALELKAIPFRRVELMPLIHVAHQRLRFGSRHPHLRPGDRRTAGPGGCRPRRAARPPRAGSTGSSPRVCSAAPSRTRPTSRSHRASGARLARRRAPAAGRPARAHARGPARGGLALRTAGRPPASRLAAGPPAAALVGRPGRPQCRAPGQALRRTRPPSPPCSWSRPPWSGRAPPWG